jgi:hypothetical protein
MFSSLQKYLDDTFQHVEGWCGRHLFQSISACRVFQQSIGLRAPIAEIGVYHGKFFIGLALLSGVPEGHCAIDVFDMQEFNLDGADHGNLEKFRSNMQEVGFSEQQYLIYRADSMKMGRAEIDALRKTTGPFSFFSVDGCHMAEHTINDVRIAIELVDPRGIIFVDDYYNADWPGVHEGICKLYLNDAPRFVPILYSQNKLFLCHISYHKKYFEFIVEHFRTNFPNARLKNVERFGYSTVNIHPDLSQHPNIC